MVSDLLRLFGAKFFLGIHDNYQARNATELAVKDNKQLMVS